jgi:small subunit ribosomal protein S20
MNKHPSAQKRHRQSVKRHARNQAIRSRVRTFVKRVRESLDAKNLEEAATRLQSATRAIDKAVTKGVLHRNTASRKISRLTRAVRSLSTSDVRV